jgi:hypothetical protein
MPKKKETGDVLDVMFPEREVSLAEGQTLKVRPLSLEDLPKVAKAFGKVLNLTEAGKSPADIAISGLEEILQIIPYCIDRPPSEVPSTAVPEIIEIVIDQNITDDAVGKWQALIQRALDLQGAVDQSENGPGSS